MFRKDYTTEILKLANVFVDKIERDLHGNHIFISSNKSEQFCPCCKTKMHFVHDYRTQKVKVFVCDMWKDYRDISSMFPNAELVTDKYHWVRQVVWAVEKVRKRVQKQFTKNKRLHFKRNKYILLTPYRELETDDRLALEYMLNQSTDLYNAWQLKEIFYEFKDSENYDDARDRLKEFILAAENLYIPEFTECIKAMHNWSKSILNTFKHKYTNAFTEGMNNNIKVLKRIAYGYRNFDNFRNRINFAK